MKIIQPHHKGRKHPWLTLIAFSMFLFATYLPAQTLVNKEWGAFCSSPDTIDIIMSTIDPSGRLAMTGNTKTVSQQNNVLTVVRNPNGTTAWSQSFNGISNGSDYGTCVTTDASGNMYVGGATYNSTSSSYDYLVLKYTSTGVLLWSRSYNGPGNGYDVVAGILVDNTGNIFVTGTSKGTGNFANLDFATIKYNANGIQQWVTRYNYLSLPDIPCGIARDNSGNIFVAGGSANSATGSDIFIVKYNSAGTQTAIYRHAVPSGNNWDKATAFVLDASGNVFITGSVYQNNTTCDMRTIKLNNNLQLQWSATYNGESKDDCANSLALDGSGGVCITGYTVKAAGGKDFTTIKYDATGQQLWVRRQSAPVSWNFGEGKKVRIDGSGGIFVAGEMDRNSNKDFLAIKYDASGQKEWEQYFNGSANGTDKAFDLNLAGNAIYVSGKTTTTSGLQYGTVKYNRLEQPLTIGTFQGEPYVQGEVTVRFDPTVLTVATINNTDLQFGIVADFVNAATIQNMNAKLGTDVTKWQMAKIFPDLLTTDTISISRLGEHVKVPTFWAAFRIFPVGIPDTIVADSLNKLQPDIWYAEITRTAQLQATANDSYYANSQASLHPTTAYPNASINVESAWDVAVGKQFVRIGVYDSGIDQTHSELSGKVAGGYDFFSNAPLSSPYDGYGHGTACAGVIAAYRNNILGIAGIAGGDGTVNNPGVSLFDFRLFDNSGNITTVNLVNLAIVDGAKSQSIGGSGLNIINASWAAGSSQLLKEAVRFAHDNDVTLAAARGNYGNTTAYYPACYSDDLVISVGASSIDGSYQHAQAGSDNYSANYQQVDLIAPGTSQIVTTTQTGTNSYQTFNGTSSATPHVAGVAGLMMSSYNFPTAAVSNLAPEDIEQIMKMTCTDDVTAPASPGYDQYSGFGRLNAGAALAAIQPGYRIHHYSNTNNITNQSVVPVQITSNALVQNAENYQGVPVGYYLANVFEVTHTFSYNDIGANETIISAWPRTSSTFGFGTGNPLVADMSCNLVSYSSTQMVLKTYVYQFYYNVGLGQAVNYYLPTSFPAGTQVAATIYTYDPTFVGMEEENSIGNIFFDAFPNPANNNMHLSFTLDESQNVIIEVFDMSGRLIETEPEEKYPAGYHDIILQTAEFAEGIYIVRMVAGQRTAQKKLIVEHK